MKRKKIDIDYFNGWKARPFVLRLFEISIGNTDEFWDSDFKYGIAVWIINYGFEFCFGRRKKK